MLDLLLVLLDLVNLVGMVLNIQLDLDQQRLDLLLPPLFYQQQLLVLFDVPFQILIDQV
jgi:hypothetical protein